MITPAQWAQLSQLERDRLQARALRRYWEADAEALDRLHIATRILNPAVPGEPVSHCPACGAWVYRRSNCKTCKAAA